MNRLLRFFPIALLGFLSACSGNDEPGDFDCTTSDLFVTTGTVVQPETCIGGGSIAVMATGGKEPFKYSINAGVFGNASDFSNLGAGDYTIVVKDKNGCEASVELSLVLPGEDPVTFETSITSDTDCFDNNGVIEITASGGDEPYQYKLGAGAFGSASTFEGLAPGSYAVSVKDALGCTFVKSVTVTKGDSNTKLSTDVRPIINENCATTQCHGGSEEPNLTTVAAIRSNASKIKTLTQSGEMPREGSLTAEEKALIACWVDEGAKNN